MMRSLDTCHCVLVFCTRWWRLSHPPHVPTIQGNLPFDVTSTVNWIDSITLFRWFRNSSMQWEGSFQYLGGVSAVARALSSTSSINH